MIFNPTRTGQAEIHAIVFLSRSCTPQPSPDTGIGRATKGFDLDIRQLLTVNTTYADLLANFNPDGTLRTGGGADLRDDTSPITFLAFLIIAASGVRNSPRQHWPEGWDADGNVTLGIPRSPMEDLFGAT